MSTVREREDSNVLTVRLRSVSTSSAPSPMATKRHVGVHGEELQRLTLLCAAGGERQGHQRGQNKAGKSFHSSRRRFQRTHERGVVGEFQVAAHGNTIGQAGDLDAEAA